MQIYWELILLWSLSYTQECYWARSDSSVSKYSKSIVSSACADRTGYLAVNNLHKIWMARMDVVQSEEVDPVSLEELHEMPSVGVQS